jgi:hypothetical protein
MRQQGKRLRNPTIDVSVLDARGDAKLARLLDLMEILAGERFTGSIKVNFSGGDVGLCFVMAGQGHGAPRAEERTRTAALQGGGDT